MFVGCLYSEELNLELLNVIIVDGWYINSFAGIIFLDRLAFKLIGDVMYFIFYI